MERTKPEECVRVIGHDWRGDTFAAVPVILDNGKKTLAVVGGTPTPASITTNATRLFLAATIGAMMPPSLWPISP